MPIDPAGAAAAGLSAAPPRLSHRSFALRLIGDIEPPVVGGVTLQATSVWMTRSGRAIVSYGVAGSTALEAMDFFMSLTSKTPRLRSSVAFSDSDVVSAFTDGFAAFAGVETSDPAQTVPAVIERFGIEGEHFRLADGFRSSRTGPSLRAPSSSSPRTPHPA